MVTFDARHTIESPWTEMEPIRLGNYSPSLPTPDLFVCVEKDGAPWKRIDLYPSHESAFFDTIAWNGCLVFGVGAEVHIVDPVSDKIASHDLGTYFGHFYPLESALLVASADKLFRFSLGGEFVWKSTYLGIDGVVVHRVENGVIYGAGEYDPPGGWRDFSIILESGERLT